MKLNVKVDATRVLDNLAGLGGQVRFAMSKALNDTANDAQRAIQLSLSQHFTLRRPDFIRRTIKRERPQDFATKDRLEASVRIDPTRDILAKFEEGGTKTPTRGKAIALPTEVVRRTKAQIIQKGQRPKALLASGRAYSKGGALFTRIGRGARALVRVAYVFKSSVRIPKRLGFIETANRTVDRTWAQRADDAVRRALATMR